MEIQRELKSRLLNLRPKTEQEDEASSDQMVPTTTTSALPAHPQPYDIGTEFAGAFMVATSNVDAHAHRAFATREIREIHGNTELFQCSRPCQKTLWRAPSDLKFYVNPRTMLVSEPPPESELPRKRSSRHSSKVQVLTSKGMGPSPLPPSRDPQSEFVDDAISAVPIPRCPCCGGPARPAILMFEDPG